MRALPAVLAVGLIVSSCGADAERRAMAEEAPVGMTRFSDERRGFEVTFPSGWVRADTVLTPMLTAPREILSVGTVDPVPNRARARTTRSRRWSGSGRGTCS